MILRYTYLLALILLGLWACQQDQENKPDPEKEKLQQEVASLRLENLDKDSSLNQVLKYFNEVQLNLAEIKSKEGIISMSSSKSLELNEDKKAMIIEDIQRINTLLAKNRATLSKLRKLVENKGLKIEELQTMIDNLQKLVSEKDLEIEALKKDLKDLKISYELLSMENSEKAELITLQEAELNKAYYCFGTVKELKEKGVIDHQGGFIGIGRSEKLSETMNQDYFTRIDYTKMTKFDIVSKKSRLVTSHPKGSYEWKLNSNGQVEQLVITQPERFWSISKYLVVVLD